MTTVVLPSMSESCFGPASDSDAWRASIVTRTAIVRRALPLLGFHRCLMTKHPLAAQGQGGVDGPARAGRGSLSR
eukprot:1791397-Rhodomonas_salina.1